MLRLDVKQACRTLGLMVIEGARKALNAISDENKVMMVNGSNYSSQNRSFSFARSIMQRFSKVVPLIISLLIVARPVNAARLPTTARLCTLETCSPDSLGQYITGKVFDLPHIGPPPTSPRC